MTGRTKKIGLGRVWRCGAQRHGGISVLLVLLCLAIGACGQAEPGSYQSLDEASAEGSAAFAVNEDSLASQTVDSASEGFLQGALDADATSSGEASSSDSSGEVASPGDQAAEENTASQSNREKPQTPVKNARKIIYDTRVELVVADFSKLMTGLPQLVAKHGGFIANESTQFVNQKYPSGNWVVRVPVEQYPAFLAATGSLGQVAGQSTSSQEVTDKFVDLQARIANARRLEERMVDLLEKAKDKLQDIIVVEKELSRVRETIERMEGQLRYLGDQTSLATVRITARQEQNYVASQASTFAEKVTNAWSTSWNRLQDFGQGFVLWSIGALPYVVVLAVLMVLLWVGWKTFRWFSPVGVSEHRQGNA